MKFYNFKNDTLRIVNEFFLKFKNVVFVFRIYSMSEF